VAALFQQRVDRLQSMRLRIHPQHRLGAGWADEQPAIVAHQVLDAIARINRSQRQPSELRRRTLDKLRHERLLVEGLHMEVVARILERPDLGHHVGQHLLRRLAIMSDHLRHQQAHQHAVAFRDVALDADAAGFLAADQHILGEHQVTDIIEAHRRLVQRQAIARRQPVEHLRG